MPLNGIMVYVIRYLLGSDFIGPLLYDYTIIINHFMGLDTVRPKVIPKSGAY